MHHTTKALKKLHLYVKNQFSNNSFDFYLGKVLLKESVFFCTNFDYNSLKNYLQDKKY